MTLPRLEAITRRWQEVPPLSVSVACIASALGAKRKPQKAKTEEQDFSGLLNMVGQQGITKGKIEWLRAMDKTT